MTRRVSIVGFGNIGAQLAAIIRQSALADISAILVKPDALPRLTGQFGDLPFVVSLDHLLNSRPNTVIECANALVLSEIAHPVLRAGCMLVAASTSALASESLYVGMQAAVRKYGAKFLIPAGAIGATDSLAAMRLSGLDRVVYRGIKPPAAWRGTEAEELCSLHSIRQSTTFFTGSARQAAISFPRNANVAATVGIAGAGLDETIVELVAEPGADQNRHEIEAFGSAGKISFQATWHPSPNNLKTSSIIPYSLLAAAFRGEGAIPIV